jgi:ribonuclease J
MFLDVIEAAKAVDHEFGKRAQVILYGPDIVTRGVVTENGSEASVEEAREVVLKAWEESGVETRKDPAEIQTDIRRALRRYFNKRLERKPVILPLVLEL